MFLNTRNYRLLQALILLGLGAYFTWKIVSGTLFFYINERFLWLIIAGAIGFFVLAQAIWPRSAVEVDEHHHHDHDHEHTHGSSNRVWLLLIVSMPVLFGFLVPVQPLDTSAIETKGFSTNATLASLNDSGSVALSQPADERNVLDWIRAFNYSEDPSEFIGEPADVVGFVYHDDRVDDDQFMVGRFALSCCVADAFAIGVAIDSPDAGEWKDNQWVHVRGTIELATFDGEIVPQIVAESIKEVPVPPQPYLFP
ncbi:MAG: TIGR03943 family protein [Chloroflexi bacterium]|nr:MAG: TIGR03943 family protein [Chloroflexota bacterium]MBL1194515.1 TIGR03943 family protein [Chloroflexota bacterium]NOH11803.1 TIGR03943 family protein [Chloroflexota bacterium]